MTNRKQQSSHRATGAKLLAILTIGAASGGCITIRPEDHFLGISPETRARWSEEELNSPESDTETREQDQQQQQ